MATCHKYTTLMKYNNISKYIVYKLTIHYIHINNKDNKIETCDIANK